MLIRITVTILFMNAAVFVNGDGELMPRLCVNGCEGSTSNNSRSTTKISPPGWSTSSPSKPETLQCCWKYNSKICLTPGRPFQDNNLELFDEESLFMWESTTSGLLNLSELRSNGNQSITSSTWYLFFYCYF